MKCKLVFIVSIIQYATPVFIRSGLNYNQNKGLTQGADFYDLSGRKIGGHVQESEGHNIAGQENNINSQDSSRYDEQSGTKLGHGNQNQYDKSDYQQDAGHQEHENKKNVGHKKGHHKSGFHNSYYKDESGNNSSYHEDEGDEGSQYTYDGRNKKYDGMGSELQRGNYYDNRHYNRDQTKNQLYDNRDNMHNDRGGRGYHNQRQYSDDGEQYAKNHANDRFDRGDAFAQSRYDNRPRYTDTYDPYYHQSFSKYPDYDRLQTTPSGHTIKIYEDPRYVNNEYRQNNWRNEYDRHSRRPYSEYDNYSPRAVRYNYY